MANISAEDDEYMTELLTEVIREAELYLEDQLTAALAADQRALSLAGMLGAATAVTVSGSLAALTSEQLQLQLAGVIGLFVSLGLFEAIRRMLWAARPTAFQFRGTSPHKWKRAIQCRAPWVAVLKETAEYYTEAIKHNSDLMSSNGEALKKATYIALLSTMIGAILVALVFLWNNHKAHTHGGEVPAPVSSQPEPKEPAKLDTEERMG